MKNHRAQAIFANATAEDRQVNESTSCGHVPLPTVQ